MSKTTNRSIELDIIHTRLTQSEQSVRAQIENGLKHLKQGVEQALKDLAGNQGRLDVHLLHNAAHLTADIARWNQIMEILPIAAAAKAK